MLAPKKCAQMLIRDDGGAQFNFIFAQIVCDLFSKEQRIDAFQTESRLHYNYKRCLSFPTKERERALFDGRTTSHLWRIEKFSFGAANQNYGTQIVESPP